MASPEILRTTPARWPLRLPEDLGPLELAQLRTAIDDAVRISDYGWGHTIDFGPFTQKGLLGTHFLRFLGAFNEWGWWPSRLDGQVVADVGAFTGGASAIMADRGAATVYAVDEMEGHVEQARVVADAFGLSAIQPVKASLYELPDRLGRESLDHILCAGVLYHCSDMLVAMIALQQLLRPGGTLLLETNAVRDFEHSYANFGRFVAGMWWQPTGGCLVDLCEFAGFEKPDVRFYHDRRALLRATKPANAVVKFRRGMNWHFDNVHDDEKRGVDSSVMAPAPTAGTVDPVPELAGRELLAMVAHRGMRTARRRLGRAARSLSRRAGRG